MTHELLSVYAMRMAAVFAIATSTMLVRTGRGPRRVSAGGYAIGMIMLVTAGVVPWVELLFPAWLLVLSVHIVVARPRTPDLPVIADG